MDLEVISQGPRAFVIENFLSDYETDEIIKLATPGMTGSTVGEAAQGGLKHMCMH
jgi:hypothetical protein